MPGTGDRGPPCAVRLSSAVQGFNFGRRNELFRDDERRERFILLWLSSELLSSVHSPLSLTTEPKK